MLCCAPARPTTPRRAIDSYAQNVRARHWDEAYALLSEESRQDLSLEKFIELMESSPREVEALLRSVESEQAPPRVTAELSTKSGQTLLLIYEQGQWRIDESAIDLYSQSEPRQTLRSFIRAYENDRYDLLLRFVPQDDQEGLSEEVLRQAWQGEQKIEIEEIVEALRIHVETAPLEVLGDQATMSYGAGSTAELVFEQGVWKIEDF